jgi:hypothetical protein
MPEIRYSLIIFMCSCENWSWQLPLSTYAGYECVMWISLHTIIYHTDLCLMCCSVGRTSLGLLKSMQPKKPENASYFVKYISYVNSGLYPHYRYSSMHKLLPSLPSFLLNWAQGCASMSLADDLRVYIPLPQITSPLNPVLAHHG